MFGIDDIALMALLGGGLGAATSKKPIQGALMGAGLGAAGGYFLPGLLGGGAAAGANPALLAAGEGATDLGGGLALGADGAMHGSTMAGSLAPSMFDKAVAVAKPVGQAASAAGAVKGLFGQPQPMQTPTPMPMNGAGSQTLGMLATQGQQASQQQLMAAEQARRQRRMGLLGGGYGAA